MDGECPSKQSLEDPGDNLLWRSDSPMLGSAEASLLMFDDAGCNGSHLGLLGHGEMFCCGCSLDLEHIKHMLQPLNFHSFFLVLPK